MQSFADADKNTLTAIKGSSGYIELFVFKDNAQKYTDAKVCDEIKIRFM